MYDLASIEIPDLQTCNSLQKIECTSTKLECKPFPEKPGSRRHLGSVNTKIDLCNALSKMAAIDNDSQCDTCIKLASKDFCGLRLLPEG